MIGGDGPAGMLSEGWEKGYLRGRMSWAIRWSLEASGWVLDEMAG